MNFKSIRLSEYDYPLDQKRIAKYPLSHRDSSKLLIYRNNIVSESSFTSIPELFNEGQSIVFNNTKVIQARLKFKKSTGASIEVFLLNPISPNDYQLSFSTIDQCVWNCVVGNIKRWKGEVLEQQIPSLNAILVAKMLSRSSDGAFVEFSWRSSNAITFADIVTAYGQVPIPPYLNREPVNADKHTYQTIYAKPEGSVAAPTAGLHFTSSVIGKIKDIGCSFTEVTLHVGAGTFKPVKSDTVGEHEMHTERIYVTKEAIKNIISSLGNIVAVGTTSMRTLESLYWLGVKVIEGENNLTNLHVNQWDGYQLNDSYSSKQSLEALLNYIIAEGLDYLMASTQMIIVPGYTFRVVDTLITNFHQPRSTLLLLVAAFIGDDWKKVYEYAINNDFRFLSYGDSSILFKSK
ncbi:MAG: S-adenosylmethionine:tRNA ribosyltransferase-isomerase [Bacteroidales bacterium]|nr:S-adenosylmethionine:tRNA ribosyltransferase-isomerase [Bacteroidales bacterium]MDD3890784.1 S-adenosylmethionine:tRNA ribosyltransferase-isomerase [Bacteroidales bacterium]